MKRSGDRRDDHLRRVFIKILLKAPLRDIKFSGKNVSLSFFGHRISDKVVVKREDHVADWSRKRKEIFVDKNYSV